jgi:tetratricopeptide (TPR) repeat protein
MLLAWLLPSGARADWPIARGPAHDPAPYRYDPAVLKQIPKEFLEEAPACLLYSGTTYLVDRDGTTETITHEITRFNGRKGVEQLGEYRSIVYEPSFQTLTLNEARVLKADGSLVPITPAHVELRDVSTDYQVYDNEKQLVISFPNLEVGDMIEVQWTTRGKNPEYGGRFFTRYNFGDDQYPVVVDELCVRVHENEPFKYRTIGGALEPEARAENGWRTYRWRAVNRRELPHGENLPPKDELRLEVSCSTFATWDEVWRWKQRLRASCWECPHDAQRLVGEITRGAPAAIDKARLLTEWVRRHIRYVSRGERHDFTPHLPGQVLAWRYGDCKDQSQLLAVMLGAAGLTPWLVTIGASGDGQIVPEVPSPWGTHAILLVPIDGQEHWIDTTTNMAPWDFLPREDRDRQAYAVNEQGGRLVRTPGQQANENRIDQNTEVRIETDGTARQVRMSVYSGAPAVAHREAWAEAPPGEQRRLVAAELQGAQPRARLRDLKIDEKGLANWSEPVRAKIDFDVPKQFHCDSDMEGAFSDGEVWTRLLSITIDPERKCGLNLELPFESVHRYTIELPPAYRFEPMPTDERITSKWGSFASQIRPRGAGGREAVLEFRTRLENERVESGEVSEFQRFLEEIGNRYRVRISLAPAREMTDVPLLESFLTKAPEDTVTARILGDLYAEHGMNADARRVLRGALVHHADDPQLWESAARVAEDACARESAYSQLVKLCPQEPRHALALARVRAQAGKIQAAQKGLQELLAKPLTQRDQAKVLYELGQCSFRNGCREEALAYLERAAMTESQGPTCFQVRQLQATILEGQGWIAEALAANLQAFSQEPEDRGSLQAIVRLEMALGHKQEAMRYLRRYTVAVAGDCQGLAKAAEFYLRLGRLDDALELAAEAIGSGPHADAERVMGLVYWQRREAERALPHLQRAAIDAQVQIALIEAFLALGDLRSAEFIADNVMERGGSQGELAKAVALVISLCQRRNLLRREMKESAAGIDKAIDLLVCAEHERREGITPQRVESLVKSALTAYPGFGPAHGLQALLHLEHGRLSDALSCAEQAVALAPWDARGHYVRGRVQLERGQSDALEELGEATTRALPADPELLTWYATALQRAGKTDLARSVRERAARLQVNDGQSKQRSSVDANAGSERGLP